MSRYLYVIIAVLLAGCTKSAELGPAPVESTYLEDLEEFYANRLQQDVQSAVFLFTVHDLSIATRSK
jgi:hypothetical protein